MVDRLSRSKLFLFLSLSGVIGATSPLYAQSLGHSAFRPLDWSSIQHPSQTHWVGIQFGSALSRQVSSLRGQGYELSGGQPVRFENWYRSNWKDLQLTWMTEINPKLGLLWGLGTGERGAKYRIDPSLQLGLIFQQPLSAQSAFSFRVSTRLGGRLKEKTCVADYGQIGGVQTVNCRLAATELPPAETLKYLFNESPSDRLLFALRYEKKF